jgi:hypothetical protein
MREKDNPLLDELKLSKKEADRFPAFADALTKLIDQDNSGTVSPEELTGGTVTPITEKDHFLQKYEDY